MAIHLIVFGFFLIFLLDICNAEIWKTAISEIVIFLNKGIAANCLILLAVDLGGGGISEMYAELPNKIKKNGKLLRKTGPFHL